MPIAICLMVFGAHMNILFLNKVKIILFTKWVILVSSNDVDY